MLTPLLLSIMYVQKRKKSTYVGRREHTTFPTFMVGFILFSLVPTFKLLPSEYIHIVSNISHYALVIAMAGIGLKISFGSILKDGKSALLLGSLVFLVQILFSSRLVSILVHS